MHSPGAQGFPLQQYSAQRSTYENSSSLSYQQQAVDKVMLRSRDISPKFSYDRYPAARKAASKEAIGGGERVERVYGRGEAPDQKHGCC